MKTATVRKIYHVKKGDEVQIISGNHKGSSGKILYILPKKDQVIVEGVRMIKKHQKPTQDNQDGGIIEREGAIHISNVKKITSENTENSKPKTAKKKTTKKTAAKKKTAKKKAAN